MKFSGGYFMHSVAILYNKYGICSKEGDYLKKKERRRREELINKTEKLGTSDQIVVYDVSTTSTLTLS